MTSCFVLDCVAVGCVGAVGGSIGTRVSEFCCLSRVLMKLDWLNSSSLCDLMIETILYVEVMRCMRRRVTSAKRQRYIINVRKCIFNSCIFVFTSLTVHREELSLLWYNPNVNNETKLNFVHLFTR